MNYSKLLIGCEEFGSSLKLVAADAQLPIVTAPTSQARMFESEAAA